MESFSLQTTMAIFRLQFLLAAILLPDLAAGQTITISKPWMRYLLPSIPAAGYMVITNRGDAPVTLTGAASPACGMLMLHESTETSGMAMMMAVPTITIPAGGSVSLAPGGYHLMCMAPVMKVGDQVPVTLTFADGAKHAATLPVYGAQTQP
jgi:copper(I)-binding protein